ncbi:MAG: hypothetical protein K2P37_09540 [Oscillospiraceae bacterium]|nr:hypothetical protein [Oscillospiraceae bacterium]
MVEPDMRVEEDPSQENSAPPAGDTSPAGAEGAKISAEDEMREILGKMPVKDKEDLQRDYGTIQYFNIVYQGNHVENSGTVYGGIAQQQERSDAAPSNPAETLQDFFRPNAQTDALAALLVLATFESVQESLFYGMVPLLTEKLRRGKESPEAEAGGMLAYLQTADELLAPFSIQRETLPFTYGQAQLSLRCLAFEDRQIPDQVRRYAWEMYPQLRPVLTEWLLHFQESVDSSADRALAYAATRELAVYASLDAEYACYYIIPLLESSCTAQADVKYLATFFRQFMQAEDCQMAGDEVLCRWCGKRDKLFWQIPYQLYSDEEKWRFCQDVPDALRKRLLEDHSGLGRLNPGWYGQNRGCFLYPAHRNRASAALLAQELSWCFSHCKTLQERYQMAVYFLVLFRWDYLTDFSSAPELSFLQGFHDKKTRSNLLPIFAFIWRYVELRNTMRQVLASHFAELNANAASAAYLEKPFEFLAFTGNRIDFQNTIKLLKDCAGQKNAQPVAEHLICHLTRALQQRKMIKSTGKV